MRSAQMYRGGRDWRAGRGARRRVWSSAAASLVLVAAGIFAGGLDAAEFGVPANPVLTNEHIVNYTLSRVESSQIIAKINSSETDFDVSPEAVMRLKDSGVSDEVLAVMSVAASRTAAKATASALSVPSSFSTSSLPPLPQPFAAPTPAQAGDQNRFANELANLHSGSPDAQSTAMAWMLANKEQSLPLLRRVLAGSSQDEQAAAVAVLGKMKDQESLNDIRRLISSSSIKVRQNAAAALMELNDLETIGAAEQALIQPSLSPLDGYIRLVGAARLVRASKELGNILAGNAAAVNRAAAAWALAEIGPPAMATGWPAVEKALVDDQDPDVRREAARAVASFHAPSSATLLKDACRRDPDVRKVTLQAMADYPETVEFLVGVMKLGEDQIAPGELAAARFSLQKLTGQDFALDGDRWSEWYAQNRTMFAAPAATDLALPPGTDDLSQLVSELHSGLSELVESTGSSSPVASQLPPAQELDVSAWGIVIDSTQIPMAPEVEAISDAASLPSLGDMSDGKPGQGMPPLPGVGGAASASSAEEGASSLGGGDSLFRTWRSEPEGSADSGMAASPGDSFGPSPQGASLSPGETQLWGSAGSGGMAETPAADDSFSRLNSGETAESGLSGTGLGISSLPSSPVVAPEPSSSSLPPSPLSGMALPLPPMMGGDSSESSVGNYSVPPPSFAPPPADVAGSSLDSPAPFAGTADQPSDPFSGSGDPTADPFGDFGEAPMAPFDDGPGEASTAAQEWEGTGDTDMFGYPGETAQPAVSQESMGMEPASTMSSGFEAASGTQSSAPLDFDDWKPYDGPSTGVDSAEAGAAPASEGSDYNTLIFPGDSYGLGDPYIEQTEQPKFDSPSGTADAGGSLPMGGLVMPASSGESVDTVGSTPPPLGSLRPPSSQETYSPPVAEQWSADDSAGTAVFVEPEPAQVVVGDDLFEAEQDGTGYSVVEEESASPLGGLSLPMPTGSPDGEAGLAESESVYGTDDPELGAPYGAAEDVGSVAGPDAMDIPPEYEEPAAIVVEVEELGVVGDGGVIIEEPEAVAESPAVDVVQPALPVQVESAVEKEVVSGVVESAAPPEKAPPPAPVLHTDKYVHNEPKAVSEIPEGIPFINEEDIVTDPSPDSPGGAVVAPSGTRAEAVSMPSSQSDSAPQKARRKRNPPRHKR